MSDVRSAAEVAQALTAAILAGDVDAVADLYHDDALVWQNTTNRTLDKRKMLGVIRFLATGVDELRYEDIRVQVTATGFVQQHVLRCVAKNGTPVEAPACLVARVVDGRIAHLDEYIDSGSLAPLMA